jgi:hypothetical protein
VIFQGALPADEGSAAALFALAAQCRQPIPVVAAVEVPPSRGLRSSRQATSGWRWAQRRARLPR